MTDAARFNDVAAGGLIVLLALGSLALLPVRSAGGREAGKVEQVAGRVLGASAE
ncbi:MULTISPECIES: hypothetical protein [Streptomyces]|uniref:hypothetical protein n=1 Tax=Streptomyces TaxID=1883 RepID=UPI001488B2AE|nr:MULTISPECIES: hypothetical protein [Streptomyces]